MSHKIQMYENLRDMLEREVTDIEKKGDLTEESLDHLYKLTAALKVVDKCIDREEGAKSGYSNTYGDGSYDYNRRGGNYRNSYDGISHMWPTPYVMDKMSPNDKIRTELERQGLYESHDGYSNARRGRDGDSDGMYNESRDNFRDNQSRNGYGYTREGYSTDGYSRDASRKKMVQKLETLMDDTMSEHERKAIQDCINKIK